MNEYLPTRMFSNPAQIAWMKRWGVGGELYITYRRTWPKVGAGVIPPRHSLNTFYPEFVVPARPPTWDHGNPLVLDHDRERAQVTSSVRPPFVGSSIRRHSYCGNHTGSGRERGDGTWGQQRLRNDGGAGGLTGSWLPNTGRWLIPKGQQSGLGGHSWIR